MFRRSVLLVGLFGAVAAGCGGGEERALDVDEARADVTDPVSADGSVVGVSPAGQVLVNREDETCIAALDGTGGECFDVELGPFEPVSWSPDGTLAAVGDTRAFQRVIDAEIRVLDLDAGELTTVADDGTDDFQAGDVDLFPAWSGDDELFFLRLPADRGEDDRQFDVVHRAIGDDEETSAPSGLEAIDVRELATAVFDGALALTVGGDDGSRVITIDEEGETDTLLRLDHESGTSGRIGGVDDDGDTMVALTSDLRTLRLGPVAYLDRDEATVQSDFDAMAAALDATGTTVAGITGPADGSSGNLVLWDPNSETTAEVAEDLEAHSITWLDDGRIVTWNTDSWRVVTITDG